MQYDGAWKLTVPSDRIGEARDWPRPLLSNGKIVLRPGMSDEIDIPTTQMVIPDPVGSFPSSDSFVSPVASSAFDMTTNTAPVFDFGRVHFFRRTEASPSSSSSSLLPSTLGLSEEERKREAGRRVRYRLTRAEMDMNTGTFTSTHEAWRGFEQPDIDVADWSSGRLDATITRTVYPCRSRQFFAVQSFRVKVEAHASEDACFFHDIRAPPTARDVDFSSPVIFSEGVSTVLFTADASAPPALSVACAYTWTEEATNFSPQFAVVGYNVDAADDGTMLRRRTERGGGGRHGPVAFNKVDMHRPAHVTDGQAHEFRFQIVTCMMGERDSDDLKHSVRRAVLRAVAMENPPAVLRMEHVRAWAELWRTDVTIVPKLGISDAESARIRKVKHALRYAMYTLHSLTRSREEDRGAWGAGDARFAVSGVVDLGGRALAQADVWLLPTLVLLRPQVARRVVDRRRWLLLDHAVTSAAALGKPGAYFAFDRSHSVILSLSTRMWVFNSALAAANAWDYYRCTRDSDWLRSTGAPLIHAVADFLRSCFFRAEEDGRYALQTSVSLDGSSHPHDSFAVNSCMLAFRAAIECSYELRTPVKKAWSEVVQGVRTIYVDRDAPEVGMMKWVYRKHADHRPVVSASYTRDTELQQDGEGGHPWVYLADPLFMIVPSQAQVSHPNGRNLKIATTENLGFYEPRLWWRHPSNGDSDPSYLYV